jgi:hypothetical protein
MKARLLRDEQRPASTAEEAATFQHMGSLPTVPAGTVIDHPEAHKLVRMGMAEPADDECRQAARMTAAELQAAQAAQEKVRRGIFPGDDKNLSDYPAYDAGLMVGYHTDGTWLPGANWCEGCEEAYYAAAHGDVEADEDEEADDEE